MKHRNLSMRMKDVTTSATLKWRWLGCILLAATVGAPSVAGSQTGKPAAQPGKAPAQATRSRTKPKGGAGQSMQQAIPVPFNPVRRDEQGRVMQALPEPREGGGESDAHPLSRRARAEKALADSHKAPRITKPLPALLGGGKFPSRLSNVPPASGQLPHIEGSFKSSPAVVGVSFAAIGYDLKIPPDVAMAAGPNQVVVAANNLVSVFDKLGNLLGTSPFSGFDPVVHYDEYIKRFWLVIANVNNATNQSTVVVSLSNGSDATNGWSNFTLDMTLDGSSQSGHWCDYPQLGFDTQAIYVSCDMFSFPSGSSSFQYGKVRVLAKSQFPKGGCCSWYDQWNLPWVVRPAIMRQAKDSDGEFLIDAAGNQGNDVQADGGGDSG